MTTKEQIKHYIIRANALAAMDKPNSEIYWQIRKDMAESQRLWEYDAPRYYWPQAMKDDLNTFALAMGEAWNKICANKRQNEN